MRELVHQIVPAAIVGTDKSGSNLAASWQQILVETRLYWPRNTAKHVSRVTGASNRTSYRWLAGVSEPPASAIIAIVLALRAEYVARGRIFEQLELRL